MKTEEKIGCGKFIKEKYGFDYICGKDKDEFRRIKLCPSCQKKEENKKLKEIYWKIGKKYIEEDYITRKWSFGELRRMLIGTIEEAKKSYDDEMKKKIDELIKDKEEYLKDLENSRGRFFDEEKNDFCDYPDVAKPCLKFKTQIETLRQVKNIVDEIFGDVQLKEEKKG
jgi:hypothetical protein